MHWVLHQKFSGRFNIAHIEHHMVLYPPDDYQSDVYRETTKNGAPVFFAITAIPVIILPMVLCYLGLLSWHLMFIALAVMGIYGFLSNYLHDAFHIRNHWLNYVPIINMIFKRWTILHWIHHLFQQYNYGIYCFIFDRIFGTFRDTTD